MTRATASIDPGGPVAEEIAGLWWVMLGLGAAVLGVVLYLLIRGLLTRPGERGRRRGGGGRWLVGGGLVLPVLGISAVFALTLIAMREIPDSAPDGSLRIEVTGHQWWWEVSYHDLGITEANEIHFPAGKPVELRVDSVDVIHSIWVPGLGMKLDLLPDYPNSAVIEADEPGVFRGACAEFCGLQHAKMRFLAVAETAEEFETWAAMAAQPASEPDDPDAVEGRRVFLDSECAECHTIRGTEADGVKGPDLTHIASRRTLAAGIVANTTENLRTWIATPQTVKPGSMMPDVELGAKELDALVSYLQTLE